jgi:hypothetical protein
MSIAAGLLGVGFLAVGLAVAGPRGVPARPSAPAFIGALLPLTGPCCAVAALTLLLLPTGAVSTATIVTAAMTAQRPAIQTLAISRSFMARRTRPRRAAFSLRVAACSGARDGLVCNVYGGC